MGTTESRGSYLNTEETKVAEPDVIIGGRSIWDPRALDVLYQVPQNRGNDEECLETRNGSLCISGFVLDSSLLIQVNKVTGRVIGAAIKVHKALGPGLLESVYSACLLFELGRNDLVVQAQVPVTVVYDGVKIDCGYRIDMTINDLVVVELKTVDSFAPIHTAQMLTYLKLTGYPAGLLINFNVTLLKNGIKRILNSSPGSKLEVVTT